MSSVNEKTSRPAAIRLHATFPAMRHQCGRRNTNKRRYIDALSRDPLGTATASLVLIESATRREQRHGQDHFLRRHAAVKKRSAIPALIFPQLRGIDEERIASRQ